MRRFDPELVDHLARALLLTRFGPESAAMFVPVAEEYPQRAEAQRIFDLKLGETRAEICAVLEALNEWERAEA